jgi:hypothetical protein
MNVALANLTAALSPIAFLALAAFLYHEDHHNGWAVFWLVIIAAITVQRYESGRRALTKEEK